MHEPMIGGIVFNPEAGSACGRCLDSCQLKAWSLSGKRSLRGANPAKFISNKCVTCGTCYYFCPQLGAITGTPQVQKKAQSRPKRMAHAA